MRRVIQLVFAPSTVYLSWLSMMAMHELGHVLHAWLSDGVVTEVTIPLFGFSRTDLADNPSPLFVAWGGPVWGSLLPPAALGGARVFKARFRYVVRFFVGFCLIANGAYIGAGSFIRAGDAGDLMRYGSPQWVLIAFGIVTVPAGLYLWNGLGKHFGIGIAQGKVDHATASGVLAALLAVVVLLVLVR